RPPPPAGRARVRPPATGARAACSPPLVPSLPLLRQPPEEPSPGRLRPLAVPCFPRVRRPVCTLNPVPAVAGPGGRPPGARRASPLPVPGRGLPRSGDSRLAPGPRPRAGLGRGRPSPRPARLIHHVPVPLALPPDGQPEELRSHRRQVRRHFLDES